MVFDYAIPGEQRRGAQRGFAEVVKESRRSFRLGKAQIHIPSQVLQSWRKVPVEEHEKIIDSVRNNWGLRLSSLERIRFEPTFEGIKTILQLRVARDDSKKFSDPTLQKRILCLLRFARYRRWLDSPIRELVLRAICGAAFENDEAFFLNLGKVLAKEPIAFRKLKQPEPLANFLIDNWIARRGACLCWFTDSALTQVVCIALAKVTFADVKKTRQRLKLYRTHPALIHRVQTNDKRIDVS